MTPPTPKDEMIVPSGYAKDHVTLAAIWIFSINILLADIRQPKKPKFCRSSEKLPFNSPLMVCPPPSKLPLKGLANEIPIGVHVSAVTFISVVNLKNLST